MISSWRASIRHIIKYILIFLLYILIGFLTFNVAQAEAPKEEVKPICDNIAYFKQYACEQVTQTWDDSQWEAFDTLISKESSWDNEAQNKESTAFGYGQFLDSTWELVGCTKTTNPNTQIDCTIKYLKVVYGSPQKALKFHLQNNWY